jgi:hypothetical protein
MLIEWSVTSWNGPHDWCGSVGLLGNCARWPGVPGAHELLAGRLTLTVRVVCERQFDGEVDRMPAWVGELTGAALECVTGADR